jgi:hypothetical protein
MPLPRTTSTNQLQRILLIFSSLAIVSVASAQDNSPYSRYGIGDMVPQTNIFTRGMAGLSAGYVDNYSVNFSNPAAYSSFQAFREKKNKKMASGRAIADFGVNVDRRNLYQPATTNEFQASNAIFSYVQVGMPLRQGWGMGFGIRPVSRVSYNIYRTERLYDPVTGNNIDSSITLFQGDGGAYLANMGTGFSIFQRERKGLEEKLSVGFQLGYFFGRKDFTSRRSLINDSVLYAQANYQTLTNFSNLVYTAGFQYRLPLSSKMTMTLGAYGRPGATLNARQDRVRETYRFNEASGNLRVDSVLDQRDVKGKVVLPATFTAGFMLQKFSVPNKEGGWMFGVDYSATRWNDYRFYGQTDSVQNNWSLHVGGQWSPVPKRSYFSNIAYRFGVILGPDYIRVGRELPQVGFTMGAGLPVPISRQAPNQVTFINLAFEMNRRGNDANLLRENLFRLSLGFSLSDIWFAKRRYD